MSSESAFPIICVDPKFPPSHSDLCSGAFPPLETYAYWEDDPGTLRYNCLWGGFRGVSVPNFGDIWTWYTLTAVFVMSLVIVTLCLPEPWSKLSIFRRLRHFLKLFDAFPQDKDVDEKKKPPVGYESEYKEPMIDGDLEGPSHYQAMDDVSVNDTGTNQNPKKRRFRINVQRRDAWGGFASLLVAFITASAVIYTLSSKLDPSATIVAPYQQSSIAHDQYHQNSMTIKLHIDILLENCSHPFPKAGQFADCSFLKVNFSGNVTENFSCKSWMKAGRQICDISFETETFFMKRSYVPNENGKYPRWEFIYPKIGYLMLYRVASYVNLIDYFENDKQKLLQWGSNFVNSTFGSFILSSSQQCLDQLDDWDGMSGLFRRVHFLQDTGINEGSEWHDRFIQMLSFSEMDYPAVQQLSWHDDRRLFIDTAPEKITWIVQVPNSMALVISALTIVGSAVGTLRIFRSLLVKLCGEVLRRNKSTLYSSVLFMIPFIGAILSSLYLALWSNGNETAIATAIALITVSSAGVVIAVIHLLHHLKNRKNN